jgi:hypothetical protein
LENRGKPPDKVRFRNMTVRRFLVIAPAAKIMVIVVAMAASTSGSHAGPRFVVLSAPQSIAAQLHHQPTVASVAAAEETLAAIAYAYALKHTRVRHRTG